MQQLEFNGLSTFGTGTRTKGESTIEIRNAKQSQPIQPCPTFAGHTVTRRFKIPTQCKVSNGAIDGILLAPRFAVGPFGASDS